MISSHMILTPFVKIDLAVKSYHERNFFTKNKIETHNPIQIKGFRLPQNKLKRRLFLSRNRIDGLVTFFTIKKHNMFIT